MNCKAYIFSLIPLQKARPPSPKHHMNYVSQLITVYPTAFRFPWPVAYYLIIFETEQVCDFSRIILLYLAVKLYNDSCKSFIYYIYLWCI